MTIEVVDVEPDERKSGSFCCLPNSSQCPRTTLILIIVTFMFFFILGSKEIIMEPDTVTCFLEVQNIPAKLVRHPTETGFVNIFQKVSHEELEDAFRRDAALPKDDRSVKVDIASGSQSCRELSVADAKRASSKTKTSSVGIMPSKTKTSSVGIMPPRYKLASEKVIISLLVLVIIAGSIVTALSIYLTIIF